MRFISFHTSRKNRDVVIKVIAKGDEGHNELEILQHLNSEPLRSDPDNSTVPVLEFLSFHDWQFAVMPFYDDCDASPFLSALECLDFMEQLLTVSCDSESNVDTCRFNINSDNGLPASQSHCSLGWSQTSVFTP